MILFLVSIELKILSKLLVNNTNDFIFSIN